MKNTSVLIADDDEEPRILLRDALESKVIKIFEASNGEEALALLRQEKISVAITDYQMPVRNGLSFIEQARSEGISIPIFLWSANVEVHEDLVKKSGGSGFFEKSADNVTKVVASLLESCP